MSNEASNPIERVLVLSGGGGRGAYQAGVCKVLEEKGWRPDVVLGTSIGATNGAMLIAPRPPGVSGPQLLDTVWREQMLSHRVQRVASGWPRLLHWIMQGAIDEFLAHNKPARLPAFRARMRSESMRGAEEEQVPKGLLVRPAVMERGGWRAVLEQNVDFEWLNAPDAPYLGITATDVMTGSLHIFWNRVPQGVQGASSKITVDHVMASSSIPGIYPAIWVDGREWWDGALVANTPLAPAIDAGATDIVVVLMTPWFEQAEEVGISTKCGACIILDALDRFLDWMFLASFRSELCRLGQSHREKLTIIAPECFYPVVSIIDYDQSDNETLIQAGQDDARRCWATRKLA